ncbi:MAG: ATP-dependent sacrificial sulfur transferase LarE [Bacteroidota bacterium]
MNKTLTKKIKDYFLQFDGTITAFSGGIDSALVLFLSRKFLGKDKSVGVISNSESLKNKDYQLALDFVKDFDIHLETIYTEELNDTNYNTNPANRCYFCKTHLYNTISSVKEKYPYFTVLNGTNQDDFGDYRPGLQAAEENSVRSPLADLGFGKKEIRELAKYYGIPFWNKPASPCLSSRVPYGNKITSAKLSQIEKAEAILNNFGFEDVRVRHYGTLCKIEVPLPRIDELMGYLDDIRSDFKEIGFTECVIAEIGLVSGNLNKALNLSHD